MELGATHPEHHCAVSLVPAEWNGRRWIAGHYVFEHEGQFDGSGAAVELHDGRPSLVVENFGLASSCDTPATRPSRAPSDWPSYPADLARLLCGFGK
jgi:hypothetical protein